MSGLFADVASEHFPHPIVGCACGDEFRGTYSGFIAWWSAHLDAVLTAHADAHYADRVRAAQEKAWDEGFSIYPYRAGARNPYRTDKEADHG